MPPRLLLRGLAALGRQSTRAVAGSVFIGLAVPPLAAWMAPLVVPVVVVLLVIAFLRTDTAGLFAARRLGLALAAVAWVMVAIPVAAGIGLAFVPAGFDRGLVLALLLQAAAPPIMSVPAFAALLGLDAGLGLVTMVASMALCPLSTPLMTALFSGGALTVDPMALAGRLAVLLAVTFAAGRGLRAAIGPARLAGWREPMDGLNVILLGLIAIGLMEGVTARFIADPAGVAFVAVLAFGVSLVALGLTALVFRAAGMDAAMVLGFAAGYRNLAIMLAATGAALPPSTLLYVAMAQFPIYLMPHILSRFLRPAP